MYARERFSERISGFRFHVVPMSRRMLFLPPTVFFQLNKLSLYFVIQKENSVPEWLIKERTVLLFWASLSKVS